MAHGTSKAVFNLCFCQVLIHEIKMKKVVFSNVSDTEECHNITDLVEIRR